MAIRRTTARLLALPAAVTLLTLASAGGAHAHVTVTPSTTEAGGYSLLIFSNGHGCEGSPTTRIAIRIPEQITSVTPTLHPTWEVEKQLVQLDEPITDAHGNRITERVGTVVYTADEPLPDGFRDSFEIQVRLPESEGEKLAFPVVQTCEEGETGWTEVPAGGQDRHDLEHPAPVVTLTAAGSGGHDDGAVDEAVADVEPASSTAAGADDSGAAALGVAGLVAGLLGLVAGGWALVRTRRQS